MEIPPEFFLNLQIMRHRIFYQKIINAADREFYSLYDVIRQFTKFGFMRIKNPVAEYFANLKKNLLGTNNFLRII
jgi:hypothetical protein